MTEQDRAELDAARHIANERPNDVREIMANITKMQKSLRAAKSRSQAAQAHLVAIESEYVREYGREEVHA